MSAQSPAQSRCRAAGRIKFRLVDQLRDDLADMASASVFPLTWLTPREVAKRLDQTGYWLSHSEPLAPFLSAEQCIMMIASALNALTANDARSWWRNNSRYRPLQTDWNARARETADRLRISRPDETRTAVYGGIDEESVIFANEDFANNPVVRRDLAILRDQLRAASICELGFAASSDQAAWVMLVYTANAQLLESVLFGLWQKASASEG